MILLRVRGVIGHAVSGLATVIVKVGSTTVVAPVQAHKLVCLHSSTTGDNLYVYMILLKLAHAGCASRHSADNLAMRRCSHCRMCSRLACWPVREPAFPAPKDTSTIPGMPSGKLTAPNPDT